MAGSEKMVFCWRPEYDNNRVPVEDAARVIDELARGSDGPLDPHDLVWSSKPRSSPTHGLFDWDDQSAATAHRLHQAKDAIAAVVHIDGDSKVHPVYESVDVLVEEGVETTAVTMFVAAPEPSGRAVRSPTSVRVSDSEGASSKPAVKDAIRELENWIVRYECVAGLDEVREAVSLALHDGLIDALDSEGVAA